VQTLSAESEQAVRGVLCSSVAGNIWREPAKALEIDANEVGGPAH
jgi:hypothetical protein